MAEKETTRQYRIIKGIVHFFYPKTQVVGAENLPDGPCILVGNHSQMHGPIACELYIPGQHYTWCAGEMMDRKEVPAYAYRDFWSAKPKYIRPFYKLLSHIIAPLSECVFTNANTIGVYHDARILSTFKQTVARLQEGDRVVIFPEGDEPFDHILHKFHDKFVDVAKLYYKRTGQAIPFVPMYLAPALKTIYLGTPIYFDPTADIAQERQRICDALTQAICQRAKSLPPHRVVPFKNIPKKQYPMNK